MKIDNPARSLRRRLAVGTVTTAVVTGMLLVAQPTPANAASIVVNPGDIRGDETTYAGWHQGYDNAELNAAITANGLSLRGKSQIINGYANNDTANLTKPGANANVASLVGTTYNVVSGAAYFQLPLFVDDDDSDATAPTFATLRPAAAHSGNAAVAGSDLWMSSKTFGTVTANTAYPLSDIIAAVNLHKSKTLAFGVLTDAGGAATVQSINFNGDIYTFAAAPTTTVPVKNADLQPEETGSNYAEWHQGYDNAAGAAQVAAGGLVLAGKSQVIKGFSNNSDALNNVNANLQFVLPEASYTVAAGSAPVFFQVPVKFDDGSGLKFTTLRNEGAGAGTNDFALTDDWQSSKALDGIPANTSAPLSDIIAALGDYKTIAVGVLTNPGTTATVSNITFGARNYNFGDAPVAGTSALVKVRDIALDESTYAGWHQGSTGVATAATDSNILNLGATKSQVIKGYTNNSDTLDVRNVNLISALTSASYTVASGAAYFQVPLFVEDPTSGDTVFTTLRPATPGAPGTLQRVDVGQQWVSSKTVGPLTANQSYLLGDILSTIKTYKVLAFGVFSDNGGNGQISDITWDGVRYTFTGNRSPVALNTTRTTPAGKAYQLTLPGSDPDNDAVSYSSAAANTVVTGAVLKYTPPVGFVGKVNLVYTVTDSLGATKNGTVSINVVRVATKLKVSSKTYKSTDKTFIRVTPSAPGGLVNGATVDIRRKGKAVATGKVVNGTVRIKVGKDLPKGTRTYGVYYRGTKTTTPVRVVATVKIK